MSERRALMLRALELAERGWGQTAPNPMVGAVLVREGEVVGEGWHERYGSAHAEVNALAAAGPRASGADLFVTLEPCTHHGKTPPCADALIAAGINLVTIATLDHTDAGGGAERLRAAGVQVHVGCEEGAARELNAPFHFTGDRPWVTLKLALSVEGAIAARPDAEGRRPQTWLTGEEARREVHRLRAGADGVAVGVGTVVSDDPELTVRDFPAPRRPPLRVIFDRQGRTPLGSKLVRSARSIPTVVIAESESARTADLRAAGVEVIVADGLRDGLRQLKQLGLRWLLVEGGAAIAGALLNADCVDRVILLRSQTSLGSDAIDAFASVTRRDVLRDVLRLSSTRTLGRDRLEEYVVRGHDV